ncbi:nuclear receptor coactivator 7 isoform X3 [Nilaparvata lugens]|uniref:nuclear receptor coactivator 7 isoform X3 n=1 Tax=Nilaparvata lugens TaxID=108931 RepID=UPI00193D7ECB|nr:nuclear receptor coactivator 7 isoform X3 [Nilaparvata lugens]
MDTEVYIHRSTSSNNNNAPPVSTKKRWSISTASTASSLDRLDEEGPPLSSSLRPPLPPPGSAGGRRKSWHVGRLDYRKRRKASAQGDEPPPANRQKRHSWWTVFLPEHFGSRSRRSSTDVGRTSDQIPWVRSKSRSVDHGFVAPFDLDSLRNKIEGRIESIDRLNKDGDGYQGSKESLTDSHKMHKSLPQKTTTYKVEANDTLTSIAAHFDTTPSELAILNRLAGSRTVFPGQVIRVPEKKGAPAVGGGVGVEGGEEKAEENGGERTATEEEAGKAEEETAILDKLRVASPKPGHVERISSPQSPLTSANRNKALERFLKICVRHITDGQGVVSGVLLVTPNAVMFDPNVSDPLVIEQGPESYGVIAPIEYVVNAAIYHDIAHMRVGNSDQARNLPKPEVYHAKSEVEEETVFHSLDEVEGEGDGEGEASLLTANQGDSLDSGDPHHSPSAREDSLLAKDETFPELRLSMVSRSSTDEEGEEEEEEEGEVDIDGGPVPRDGAAFPKAFERDLVTPTNLVTSTDKLEEETPTIGEGDETEGELEMDFAKSLEERRKSSLDHHWAVPSKPHSLEDTHQEGCLATSSPSSTSQLVKSSCLHDSGIDIREPPLSASRDPPLPPLSACRKTVYSDADVLLAPRDQFVPPIAIPPPPCGGSGGSGGGERKKTTSVSFSLEEEQPVQATLRNSAASEAEREVKKSKMKKRLSYPLSWMEGIVGEGGKDEGGGGGSSSSLPSSADSHTPSSSHSQANTTSSSSHSHSSVFSKVFSRRSSVGTFIRQQNQPSGPTPPLSAGAANSLNQKSAAPKLDYRSMVSVDDMPELFASFDKLIPRPAKCFEDPPLYLRLRMGKPLNKKIPKSTPVMSYGKKKMRPEYWFSVPRERVDDLYRFLTLWVPHLYGDLVEEKVHERGYELVESDTELWESDECGQGGGGGKAEVGRQGSSDDEVGDLRESWEVIKAPYAKLYTMIKTQATLSTSEADQSEEVLSMSEELRRALYASSAASLDLDLSLPDLNGVTEILTEDHRKQLCRHLPARAEGYVWTLVFSTSQHGFSLNSMYRKMNRIESPILLVIQDTDSNVFGGLTSCALKVSEHFYGTGESLLYTFTPEFHVYNWTGDNMYFIKGNNESLSIGAGDGKFGLWLDGDLNQGRTEACNTYGNDPLTPSKDFVIKTLECWAFV